MICRKEEDTIQNLEHWEDVYDTQALISCVVNVLIAEFPIYCQCNLYNYNAVYYLVQTSLIAPPTGVCRSLPVQPCPTAPAPPGDCRPQCQPRTSRTRSARTPLETHPD